MKSVKPFIFFLLLNLPFIANASETPPVSTSVRFFSTTLSLKYDASILKKKKHCTSTGCIKKFYGNLDESNYQVLLDDLQQHKEKLQLNDWLFFNLVRKSVESIYKNESDMFHTTTTWFFMTKAGYDTRLYTTRNKYTFIYVKTEDTIFDAAFIKIKGVPYVNLTTMYLGLDTRKVLFDIVKFQPGQTNSRTFSFDIKHVSELPPLTTKKELKFKVDREEIVLNFNVDTLGNSILQKFPTVKPIDYIQAPISATTLTSLEEALKPHLEGKTLAEQMSILVSLTRKAFPYKNDQMRFRKDISLTADQLMMADSSDYEDRCALLYNLLKETTDLNFVVVRYIHDDIVTIGVELPEVIGKPFEHEGVKYTICDPTMPRNSSRLGLYPINLDKDIEVMEVVRQHEELGAKE